MISNYGIAYPEAITKIKKATTELYKNRNKYPRSLRIMNFMTLNEFAKFVYKIFRYVALDVTIKGIEDMVAQKHIKFIVENEGEVKPVDIELAVVMWEKYDRVYTDEMLESIFPKFGSIRQRDCGSNI